jgi:hypothetical protein
MLTATLPERLSRLYKSNMHAQQAGRRAELQAGTPNRKPNKAPLAENREKKTLQDVRFWFVYLSKVW